MLGKELQAVLGLANVKQHEDITRQGCQSISESFNARMLTRLQHARVDKPEL
jgi:hypothetical protein